MAVSRTRPSGLLLLILVIIVLLGSSLAWAQSTPVIPPLKPEFSEAVAFDVSPPLRSMARVPQGFPYLRNQLYEVRPEWGPEYVDHGYSGDGALQMWKGGRLPGGLIASFEGLSNQDNFNVLGGRVTRPIPAARSDQTTMLKRSTWFMPSTTGQATSWSDHLIMARCGPASRSPGARKIRAIQLCFTIAFRTAGSSANSPRATSRSTGIVLRFRPRPIRPEPTIATRSMRGNSSPIIRSTEFGEMPTSSRRATSGMTASMA